ncbi:hypothetical protein K2X33_13335, partial [bacterium]|nr:hypothetical protein [bacterium]
MIPLLKFLFGLRYRRYQRKLGDPRKAQHRVFASVVRELSQTEYGQSLGVSSKMAYADFNK